MNRFLREGHSRTQAAVLATRQIFLAILGCTATLMFAFLPLMMISGDSGKFIRVLPTAVLVTVGASLLVALTIIPFLASRMLKEREAPHGNRLLQAVTRTIHRIYQPLLHRALARPRLTVWGSLGACLALMLGVGGLIGFSLFPKADTPHFLVTIESPDGSSLAETDRALRFVEARAPDARGEVLLLEPRARQSQDLLQRARQRGRQQLCGRFRVAQNNETS